MPGKDVPSIGWGDFLHIDKIVHFVLFGGLFVLTSLPILKSSAAFRKKKNALLWTGILVVIYGLLVEIIQHYFIPGRTFDLWDWAADSTGVFGGVFFLRYLKKKYL